MTKMAPKRLWILLSLALVFATHSFANDEDDDFEDSETIVEDDDTGIEKADKEKYIAPKYQSPKIDTAKTYFLELFDDKKAIGKKWLKSESKKEGAEEAISKYDGEWSIGESSDVILENDYGLIVRTKARHHAIAAKFQKPFKFDGMPFVVQYEVKYEEGQECGGGYLKLLEDKVADNLKQFNDKSPYVIMFGPDKCGISGKVHFIVRHKNPKNGTIDEHHAKQSVKSLTNYFEDKKTHLYTLVINPDNTFRVSVDKSELMSGNLLTDLEPSITPPKQIPDPDDKKPPEWDDRVMVDDVDAKKPEDWDENQPKELVDEDAVKPADWLEEEEPLIPDPASEKPKDWDEEMDGEWEPRKMANPMCKNRSGCGKWTKPMKINPLYKGKWTLPRISNPTYKGPWTPKLIDNPHYFETVSLAPISAIGIELWTMSFGIVFDNIIVTDDENVAKSLTEQTFDLKKRQEKIYETASSDSRGILKSIVDATEQKPWLWVVIILALLIPIILISIFCFGRKSRRADRKKTDEPIEDEIVEMNEAQENQDEEEEVVPEQEEVIDEEVASADQQSTTASSASSHAGSKASTPNPNSEKNAELNPIQLEEVTIQNVESSPPHRPTKRIRARRQE